MVRLILAVIVRRLLAPLLSLLEEASQLLHGLLDKFLRNVWIFNLLVSPVGDHLVNLIHALLAQHAHIREVTVIQVKQAHRQFGHSRGIGAPTNGEVVG